jgi:tRNA-dihydrouridine synthase B
MQRIAESVMRSVKLPVTLKTRLGWDENSIVIVDAARMLESIGVKALTVHCRLRSQGNKGEADWSWVKRIKDAGITIPIILNGNIKTPADVKYVFDNYQPDAVMIGQGAIQNPWIFRQSKEYLSRGLYIEPQLPEIFDTCKNHLNLSCDTKGELKGVIEFRKFYSGYLKGLPNISKFRMELMAIKDLQGVLDKLNEMEEMYTIIQLNG